MQQHNNGASDLNQQLKDTPNPVFEAELFEEKKNKEASADTGLFELQTANEAIKEALTMPDPIYLFPQIIQQNEFIILFADTGIGKTIFAFQTAIHIAGDGHKVIYLDLELSKKQYQKRYTSEDGTPYNMPDSLYRVGYSRMRSIADAVDYSTYFIDSVKKLLDKTGAKVLYIDNLTKLSAGSTDSAKDTIPILNALNALQAEYELTIIAIEHNKKVDSSRPIALNDLQGSKMKANLCDSILSIGRSATDRNIRYVKQVKVRDGEHLYDTDNVIIYELSRTKGYLSFGFIGYGVEQELIRQPNDNDKESTIEKVKELSAQGKSQRTIAGELSISLGAVNKYLKL